MALIVATSSYQDPELSHLRATADDSRALTGVLGDPDIGGFTVTSVIDADERQVRRAMDVFLSGRSTGDVVLVYLSCHGVLDRRNRLYFAASDTVKSQLSSTGIPAAWLLEELDECRARQQVVILDCCFSGAFAKGSKGDGELDLERRLAGSSRGRAVLTASRSGEYSFTGDVLPGAAVSGSVFTAGLVEGLRTGVADTGGDGYVSVDEAYDFAYHYVLSFRASQTPQRWLSGGEGTIVLARSPAGIAINPAALPEELADALESRYPTIRIGAVQELGTWLASDDPRRALTAEQKLRQIADNDNQTVAAAARACLTTAGQAITRPKHRTYSSGKAENVRAVPVRTAPKPLRGIPGRRIQLLADAEQVAQSITSEGAKVRALCRVAREAAAVEPDRAARLLADAERTAQSLTVGLSKTEALCEVAQEVASTQPDRAAQLIADAERAAQSITDEKDKGWALYTVVEAVARTDPDRAERIAQSITSKADKAVALHAVAQAVVPTDPDRAERIAQSITSEVDKAVALSWIARKVAPTQPDRAARLLADAEQAAQSITSEGAKVRALCRVAREAAAVEPDRAARLLADAERTAQSLTVGLSKTEALCEVAQEVASTQPDRAAQLIADAERAAQSITAEKDKGWALYTLVEAVARTDPDRAERIAQSITSKADKARALHAVAQAVVPTDPDRAERIAQSITSEVDKAVALSWIARAAAD